MLALVTLLFFGVRFGALVQAAGRIRFIAIALFTNFVLIPLLGYGVASVMMAGQPLVMLGLLIYFVAPCTDWFLAFTRMSGGNVALGTALIPLNMGLQLLLYPLYLGLFTRHSAHIEPSVIGDTLLHWFLAPLLIGVLTHALLRRVLGAARFERVLAGAARATSWFVACLVMEIFASNIGVILLHADVFARLLLSVFIFFAATFLLGEAISRLCGLAYPERALLTMTTAARNAPLMLAVTTAAIPGQPLVYAALVLGMLVEFPHLTALLNLLLGTGRRQAAAQRGGDPLAASSSQPPEHS